MRRGVSAAWRHEDGGMGGAARPGPWDEEEGP
jgi:hypothetical protein